MKIKTIQKTLKTLPLTLILLTLASCSAVENLNLGETVTHIGKQLKASHPIDPKAGPKVAKAVKSNFSRYKSAIRNNNGSAASKLVSQSTIDYYTRIKKIALSGPAPQVRNLGVVDKLIVLTLRHRVPRSRLDSMSGKDLFEHTVSSGWTKAPQDKLGFISGNEELAFGHLSPDGKPGIDKLKFMKEANSWKFDVTSLLEISEKTYKEKLSGSNSSPDQFVLSILENSSGKKVRRNIWYPNFYR